MDPTATVYSDEASMANGSNGESTLLMVTPQMAMSSGFHPQIDGQTERAKRSIEEMMRHTWDEDRMTGTKD